LWRIREEEETREAHIGPPTPWRSGTSPGTWASPPPVVHLPYRQCLPGSCVPSQAADEKSLGSSPLTSLGEERRGSPPRGVSVRLRREEEDQKPPDCSGERNGKIGWTSLVLKAQGVVGWHGSKTRDGNLLKRETSACVRKERREEERIPSHEAPSHCRD